MIKFITFIFITIFFFSCSTRAALKKELALEYYNLGNYYYKNNNITDAIEFFKKAIEFNPELVKANYNLTLVLIIENRSDEANEILLELLKSDPENISLLHLLGYSYYMQAGNEEALNIFNTILNIQPEDLNAVYNKGIILWRMDKVDDAIECFNQIISYTKDADIKGLYLDSLYSLGEIMISIENWDDAVLYLNRFLEDKISEDEARVSAMLLLIDAYKSLERFDMVLETYELLIESDAENIEAWIGKAAVLLTKIEFPVKGLEALSKAIELGFNDQEYLRALLDNPGLIEKEAVEDLLKEYDIFPPEAEVVEDEPIDEKTIEGSEDVENIE